MNYDESIDTVLANMVKDGDYHAAFRFEKDGEDCAGRRIKKTRLV